MATTSTLKSKANKKRVTFSMDDETKSLLRDVAELRFTGNESAALAFAVRLLTAVMVDPLVLGQRTEAGALQAFVELHKGK